MVQNQQMAAQQAQLERIKAALPLLTLQQQAQAGANAAKVALGGAPNTSIGAAGGSADVPAEYLPYFQEASQKTGIPVALLIAQAKQESGFNANATGGAGEVGIMQILPATARNPGGGMTGVDPKDLRDPRTNIMFGAQYLAARLPKGASANDPAAVEAALKAYNGGGDPNYVKNVLRYVPGAQAGVAKASAPPATGANAPVQIPPVTPPVAGSPPPPPGQQAATPPAPGTAVVAGPGAPTDTTAPPAQVQPPAVFTPRQLTPSEQAATSYALPPEQEAGFRRGVAEVAGQPDAAAKIAAIEQARTAAIATQREKADAARLAIEAADRGAWQKQQEDAAKFAREDAAKQAAAVLAQRHALELKAAEGEQARQTAAAGSENSYVLDERKRFGTERDGARAALDNLQLLRALSDAAGTNMALDNVPVGGGKTGRDLMVAMGLGTDAAQQHWGAQQAFQAAANQMILELRKGVALGGLSDRDMSFLQNMGPSLLQQPQTRASIIGLLEAAQAQKRTYIDAVEQLWDGGKGMTWGQAKRAADKQMPDLMRSTPKDYSLWGLSDKQQWFRENIPPGSVYRGPDGALRVAPLKTPGSTP